MNQSEPNKYSKRWFKSFHIPISNARTDRELNFICSYVPLPQFLRIADLCCGMGRHARALSDRGYSVTGVDRDVGMMAKARALGGGPHYLEVDLRKYQPERKAYDAVIVMGQSFGHFDATTNRQALQQLTNGLRPGGRLILDLWNPDFFVSHEGDRDFEVPDGIVHETKRIENGRLFVQLSYPGGDQEHFEWQLFTRAEMEILALPLGLTVIACCTDFDPSTPPCASKPRLQFVFEHQ